MKKFYLLSFLLCLCLASFGQTTIYIYAAGVSGSYTTGSGSMSARTEGTMTAIPFMQRAYAVFDLAGNLPPGANILTASVGFNIESVSGSGGGGNIIRGFNGNLSTVTVPTTLYTDMGNPTATNIYTTAWPLAAGNVSIPSAPAAVSYLQNSFNGTGTGVVSLVWAAGSGGPGGLTYDITGETGTTTTFGAHAPFLRITYDCPALATTATGPGVAVCANTPFALTGSATGATSYLWTGPGGFTSTMASPTVAAGATSTGTYTLVASDGAGCAMTATTMVVINPAPNTTVTAVSSPAFCAGGNALLSVPSIAGNTYQWYDGGTPIPGATNAGYVADTSGNYKVSVTDAVGCSGISAVGLPTVLLDGPVSISPASPIRLCNGDNAMMTVNTNGVTGGIEYQWKLAGVDIPGATNASYNTSTSGVYSVAITVPANSCTASSVSDTVIVNAFPVPTVSSAGGVISTASTFATYQWFLNTVAIPGATNASVIPTSNGSYRVRVTDINGCAAFSNSLSFTSVGVGHVNKNGVSIYPNPAGDIIHVESPEAVKAVITGLEGKKLLEQAEVKEMNISGLAPGMYIISLYNDLGERVAVQQFVKQ